ncbi:MAG: SMP-30/gluconolactonase/LRE family protein [bacterium]|nr:SMP-30/gluconolactonase/LRE family protein [bacterium]
MIEHSIDPARSVRPPHHRFPAWHAGVGVLCAIFAISALVACGGPKALTVQSQGLFPEGLEYDDGRDAFLITSLTQGQVHAVREGQTPELIVDDQDLVSAIGLRIDRERDLLFVCSSDPGVSAKTAPATQKQLAGLGVYDLNSGEKKKFIRLDALNDGAQFCNDIALGPKGALYVTNSFSPVVYKVDADLKASVLAEEPALAANGFGLNGIVMAGKQLLVAHSVAGSLHTVDPASGAMARVDLSDSIEHADGLVLLAPNRVAVAQNAINQVAVFESTDNWKTAKRVRVYDQGFSFPTTGVFANGKLFYLNGKLHELFGGNRNVPEFEIRELPLN